MDLRLTEKQIWLEIWRELYGSDHDHHLIDHILNKFVDNGWMNSDAKVERYAEAMHIVMAKIWKNVPRKVREDALKGYTKMRNVPRKVREDAAKGRR